MPPPARPLRSPAALALALLLALSAIAAASLLLGPAHLHADDLLLLWQGHASPRARTVMLDLRLPRLLLGLLAGASLAVAGSAMQSLTRNPLADPGLMGVSGGAALGAALSLLALGSGIGTASWLPVGGSMATFALVGGLLAALLALTLAGGGHAPVYQLLLAGMGINALTGALLGLVIHLSSGAQLKELSFWLFGSLARAQMQALLWVAPVIALATAWLMKSAGRLDLLLLGEAEARALGLDTQRFNRQLLFVIVLLVAFCVSLCGMIGFIGLIVPQLVRLLVGGRHRALLPLSALAGALLLTLADLIARTAFAPRELPVGVLTAALGAPFFLTMLGQRQRRWQ